MISRVAKDWPDLIWKNQTFEKVWNCICWKLAQKTFSASEEGARLGTSPVHVLQL